MFEWLNNKLRVLSGDELDDRDFLLRLSRASQTMRSHQSHRGLPLVLFTGLTFCIALWEEAPSHALLFWTIVSALSAVARTLICRRIEASIEDADQNTLARNERWLLISAMCNTILVGSGFWFVGLYGSDRAIAAVTLLSCMYGIGTTVNSSVHYPPFPFILAGNMAQGVLFHSGLGTEPEAATLVSYMSIVLLLLVFGKENARVFAESIRIRVENLYLVQQLAAEKLEVEGALKVAEDANESKNRFLAAASHDLRQPLHALSLFHGSLKLEVKSERGKSILDRVDETTTVLNDQFNSLLDLSRFDAGGVDVDLSEFRIDDLLYRIVETNRPLAEARNLDLTFNGDPAMVKTDELLLERVIQNLLSNAIRYTRTGTIKLSIELSIAAGPEQTGEIIVWVEDTGVGISKEDQEKIFEDFSQLENPERRREQGVGLGLAIVRRIDQLLDLQLELISSPGNGTRFSLRLPCVDFRNNDPTGLHTVDFSVPVEFSFGGFSVWSVDDDERVRDALAMQLRTWRCEVNSFESGVAVQDYVARGEVLPDLLLLDDMIEGGARGLELANWFANLLPSDRIILITGNTDRNRLAELQLARFKVLQKPVPGIELGQIISQLFRQSGS